MIPQESKDSSTPTLKIGDLVAGRYKIQARIAEGGIGIVYQATDEQTQQQVALKIPRKRHYADVLRQEAELLVNLEKKSIPNIAQVYAHGPDPEVAYYVAMRFYERLSLDADMEKQSIQFFSPQEALEIASKIQPALDRTHEAKFLHKDLKLSNILRGQDGQVVLTDFSAGSCAPSYASPEHAEILARGTARELDRRSDLYSLGVVLYKMLTGKVPLEVKSLEEADQALNREKKDIPLPSSVNPDLPPEVDAVLMKALTRSRERRYQTARELVGDLRNAVQAGQAPGSMPGAVAQGAARRRIIILIPFLIFCAAAAIVLGPQMVSSPTPEPTDTASKQTSTPGSTPAKISAATPTLAPPILPTDTPTPTPTPTNTPTPTSTPTDTPTPSPTVVPTLPLGEYCDNPAHQITWPREGAVLNRGRVQIRGSADLADFRFYNSPFA